MENITIDLRLLSFATLGKQLEKELNTDKIKNAIRNKTATFKFADYCNISYGDNTKTIYRKDGKIIELDKTSIIEEYCKENGIDIIKETRKDYSITFKPSEKAKQQFKKALTELEKSEYKNLAKTAQTVKNII